MWSMESFIYCGRPTYLLSSQSKSVAQAAAVPVDVGVGVDAVDHLVVVVAEGLRGVEGLADAVDLGVEAEGLVAVAHAGSEAEAVAEAEVGEDSEAHNVAVCHWATR